MHPKRANPKCPHMLKSLMQDKYFRALHLDNMSACSIASASLGIQIKSRSTS